MPLLTGALADGQNFHDRLDKRTVVHIWKEKQTMNQVLTAGYRTLLSNYDAWYLDHLEVTWDKVRTLKSRAGGICVSCWCIAAYRQSPRNNSEGGWGLSGVRQ